MIAVLIYLLSGLALSGILLSDKRIAIRIWMGLVFGCVLLMWLPCLFAFAFGFTVSAQYCALAIAGLLALGSLFLIYRKKLSLLGPADEADRRDRMISIRSFSI